MSSTYTTQAGTVSFTAMADSWSEPARSDVDVIAFPGGDAVAISISGQRETRRQFKALFATIAAFRTMRDMRASPIRATAGSLFVENWDTAPVNALLVGIQPDPMQVDGQVIAQVAFILY